MERYNQDKIVAIFKSHLIAENKNITTIKNYLSDVRHYLSWLHFVNKNVALTTSELISHVDCQNVENYKYCLKKSLTPISTINRRLSSLRNFFEFSLDQAWINSNPASQVTNEGKTIKKKAKKTATSIAKLSQYILKSDFYQALNDIRLSFSKFRTKTIYHPKPSLNHIYLATLFLLLLLTIIFLKQITLEKTTGILAQNIGVKASGRNIYFEGRLSDVLDSPINNKVPITFRLYNDINSGMELYNSGTCTITPNGEGYFSVAIGINCGPTIASSVFIDNTSLFLGVKIGKDPEMRPRQQVANFGLASNSNKLSNMSIGSTSLSIPYIDQNGSIMLSSDNPGIRSILNSRSLSLTSSGGVSIESAGNGDILLAATESGSLKFQTGFLPQVIIDNNGNLGVGNSAPSSKFSVGGLSEFQVDSKGNLIKINNLSYSWPNSQGAENSILTNNGNGGLTWKTIEQINNSTNTKSADQVNSNNVDHNASIVPNASFEIITNTSNLPDGWINKSGSAQISTSSKHGTYALTLDDNNDAVVSSCFPIAANDSNSYTVSAWHKASKTTSASNLTIGLQTYKNISDCNNNISDTFINAFNVVAFGTEYSTSAGNATPKNNHTWAKLLISVTTSDESDIFIDGLYVLPSKSNFGLDLAETYPVSASDIPQSGEIVSFGSETTKRQADIANITRSLKRYDSSIFGVVSTKPGHVLDDINKYDKVNVALAGRVPIKVTTENGPISTGDPITSSSIPGVGMKATEYGKIIGYAINNHENPDTNIIAQITVFLSPGYFYPPDKPNYHTNELYVNFDTENIYYSILNYTKDISGLANTIDLSEYKLVLKTGKAIETALIAGSAQFAKIESGLLKTTNIIAKNTVSTKNLLSETIATTNAFIDKITTETVIANNKILSPVVETTNLIASGSAKIEKIETTTLSPKDSSLEIDLSNDGGNTDKLSEIIIKGLKEKKVASIDAEGNITTVGTITANDASISGQIIADNLEINQDATISGNLNAAQLTTGTASISGVLSAKEIHSDNISAIEDRINSLTSSLNKSPSETGTNSGELQNKDWSSEINEIQRLLGEIKNAPIPNPEYYQNIVETIPIRPAKFDGGDLGQVKDAVFTGQTNMYNAAITNSLIVGTVNIEDSSILSLGNELKLSALSSVNILDGAVGIGRDGTLTTQGAVIANDGVRTDYISPISQDGDIAFLLGNKNAASNSGDIDKSKFKIISNNSEVAHIDSSGSAYFANGISVDKYTDASSSAAILTADENFAQNGLRLPAILSRNQTAGEATLPAGSNQIVIYNDKSNQDALIYVTATTPTQNKILYIASKENCGSIDINNTCKNHFSIGIDEAISTDIKFNWWIVN